MMAETALVPTPALCPRADCEAQRRAVVPAPCGVGAGPQRLGARDLAQHHVVAGETIRGVVVGDKLTPHVVAALCW